ncbi:hypothetical protein [Pseudotabrizicola sp. 4114]|uniref:hypothetical protein n=1 Tax=Pseudotabrizicola sp. 4114 TaxID=2817731 RepID=UPI0028609EBF|nr:hypothetical protein [Pseudorhodobacter sp. 4114]
MPFLIALLAAAGGIIWWWIRSNPRDALSLADDAITVVRNAPRKIAFRRQAQEHAVEGIDDARLAVATIAEAFLHLDDLPTKEARHRLHEALRRLYSLSPEQAEEMDVLARWLQDQCGSPSAAISRVGRRLFKIDADKSWGELTEALGAASGDTMSARQEEAIADLRIAFRRR